MKKRTKIELAVFAIVAVFYLFTQISGILTDDSTGRDAAGSSIETELKSDSETAQVGDAQSLDYDNAAAYDADEGNDAAVPDASADAVKAYASNSLVGTGTETVAEDGVYTDKDQVALYIASYGHLPANYITKSEAKAKGWVASEGNLAEVCPGMSIGGDKFGNREGRLPEKKDRKYYECDINFDDSDGYRGSERIIYSNDGLVYYTGDHYNTFELLYGEP